MVDLALSALIRIFLTSATIRLTSSTNWNIFFKISLLANAWYIICYIKDSEINILRAWNTIQRCSLTTLQARKVAGATVSLIRSFIVSAWAIIKACLGLNKEVRIFYTKSFSMMKNISKNIWIGWINWVLPYSLQNAKCINSLWRITNLHKNIDLIRSSQRNIDFVKSH